MAKVVVDIEVRGEEEIRAVSEAMKDVNSELAKTEQNAKDASKGVDDVASNGGAIAILDQLTGGLATRLRDAYEASKLFNGSLKGMRAALVATGVGALVVALGVVVAYWDEIVEFITDANKQLEKQVELLESSLGILDKQIANLEKQIAFEQESGKNADHLIAQRNVLLKQAEKENELRLNGLKEQLARLEATQSELTIWEQIEGGFFRMFGGSEGLAQKAIQFTQDRQAEVLRLKDAIEAAEGKAIDLNIALAGETKTKSDDGSPKTRAAVDSVGSPEASPRVEFAKLEAEQLLIEEQQLQVDLDRLRENAAKAEMERSKAVAEQNLAVTATALGAISNLIGQASAEGKALGIAQATIDTFIGANKALAQGGFLGIATAATVIATGLANVQRIASTQLPGVSGSFGGSTGGGGATAPQIPQANFNVVGDSGIDTLADSISSQQNQPIRAYVTQQDITTNAQMERETRNSSTV